MKSKQVHALYNYILDKLICLVWLKDEVRSAANQIERKFDDVLPFYYVVPHMDVIKVHEIPVGFIVRFYYKKKYDGRWKNSLNCEIWLETWQTDIRSMVYYSSYTRSIWERDLSPEERNFLQILSG